MDPIAKDFKRYQEEQRKIKERSNRNKLIYSHLIAFAIGFGSASLLFLLIS